jgi:N-methylhydantoinase A
MDAERFRGNFRELEAEVVARLERDGIAEQARTISYTIEMRYGVQVHTVRLTIDRDLYLSADFDRIATDFDAAYDKLYGKGSGYADAGRYVTSFTVEGAGQLPIPARAASTNGSSGRGAVSTSGTRNAYFGDGFHDTTVHRYDQLHAGDKIAGPAIIEATETTIVVPPGSSAALDEYLNVRIKTASRNGGTDRA